MDAPGGDEGAGRLATGCCPPGGGGGSAVRILQERGAWRCVMHARRSGANSA